MTPIEKLLAIGGSYSSVGPRQSVTDWRIHEGVIEVRELGYCSQYDDIPFQPATEDQIADLDLELDPDFVASEVLHIADRKEAEAQAQAETLRMAEEARRIAEAEQEAAEAAMAPLRDAEALLAAAKARGDTDAVRKMIPEVNRLRRLFRPCV